MPVECWCEMDGPPNVLIDHIVSCRCGSGVLHVLAETYFTLLSSNHKVHSWDKQNDSNESERRLAFSSDSNECKNAFPTEMRERTPLDMSEKMRE